MLSIVYCIHMRVAPASFSSIILIPVGLFSLFLDISIASGHQINRYLCHVSLESFSENLSTCDGYEFSWCLLVVRKKFHVHVVHIAHSTEHITSYRSTLKMVFKRARPLAYVCNVYIYMKIDD